MWRIVADCSNQVSKTENNNEACAKPEEGKGRVLQKVKNAVAGRKGLLVESAPFEFQMDVDVTCQSRVRFQFQWHRQKDGRVVNAVTTPS